MKTGAEFRKELTWRMTFETVGRWGIPVMRKQSLIEGDINLLAYSDTRPNDNIKNTKRGVHFFVDDPRFEGIYTNPERSLSKLKQYRFLLTPDFSIYADMKPWMQLASVAKSRWLGAYWQSRGLTVYPTISWGSPQSYEFCFKGFEPGGTVAIATYACKLSRALFLQGYREMLRQLEPEHIICFDKPFVEMKDVDVIVNQRDSLKVVR